MRVKNKPRHDNIVIVRENFWGDTTVIARKRRREPELEIELDDKDVEYLIPVIGFGFLGCIVGVCYNIFRKRNKKGRK